METRQVVEVVAMSQRCEKALVDIATELREQRYTMRETNCHLNRIVDLLATQAKATKLASGKE